MKRFKSEREAEELVRLAKEADQVTQAVTTSTSGTPALLVPADFYHCASTSHPEEPSLVSHISPECQNIRDNIAIQQEGVGHPSTNVNIGIESSTLHTSDVNSDLILDISVECDDLSDSSDDDSCTSSSTDQVEDLSAQSNNCDLTELFALLEEVEKSEAAPDSQLKKKLAVWVVEKNVVHRQVDDLLKILQSEGHPTLPSACKTLLRTPKNVTELVRSLGAGTFWYQGIQKGMQPFLCEEHLDDDDTATIDVYVDGASPYSTVKLHLWPIVGCIVGSDPPILFIIGIWCGRTKDPVDLDEYLKDFVKEAKLLMEVGFPWNGRTLKLKIRRYCADAPARAFLKRVLSHNSYGSCERCSVYGQWSGRVIFPAGAGAELRTDETFAARSHAAYHTGDSPLEDLGTGMISQFPLDGMHLLYLGVMKKLLHELLNVKKPGNHKISDMKKAKLSSLLAIFSQYCPSEFSRKPRSLDEWKHYRAHELRRILLYDGVLLYLELPDSLRHHFLLLHCAVRILSDNKKRDFFEDADKLLKLFVKHGGSRDMYGRSFLVYNVHHLEHFAADCMKHGTVEDFSVFLNENFLGKLTKMLNTPGRTLTQLIARILEQVKHLEPNLKKRSALELHSPHSSGPVLDLEGQQYKKICIQGMVFRSSLNDACCCMKSGEVISIENFVKTPEGQLWVIGKPFYVMENMYTYPMQSSILGIYKVSRPLALKKWIVDDIEQKCMLLPILENEVQTGSFCCMPMLQNF